MSNRCLVVIIFYLLSISFFVLPSFANDENIHRMIDRTKEVNARIDAEYLKKFALDKSLTALQIQDFSKIAESLNKKIVKKFTFNDRRHIGEALIQEFLQENNLEIKDTLLLKYVATVGKFVASHMDKQDGINYVFGILDDSSKKVFVFPGGYIFVTKGLLRVIENEAELAACLAREIASVNDNILFETLLNSKENYSLMNSLRDLLSKQEDYCQNSLDEKQIAYAKKPYSDPFATLDYFASPQFEDIMFDKNYVTRKLLKNLLISISNYEDIVKKDRQASIALAKSGYSVESLKDFLLNLNKDHKQRQVVSRTINIKNWLGNKKKLGDNANKVEGRYMMMVQRLDY